MEIENSLMDVRKIVVIVEDSQASTTALQWALHNLLRYGDLITLLHVFPSRSRNKNKIRLLRLKGFHLALSFQDICNNFFINSEIIVTEGDEEGKKITAMVREIGASVVVIGLHESSFLYKVALTEKNVVNMFNCRVLAIKQPQSNAATTTFDSSTNMDFSQIHLSPLEVPEIPQPKIPYRICPSPSAIIWRPRKSRRKKHSS